MNNGQPAKKSLLPGGGSKQGRIIIVVVSAMVVIMVIIIVIGLINNAGKADTSALVTAAKQQQELIRVAKIGSEKAKAQAAKNIAITTQLALESEQAEMKAAIEAAGLKANKVLVGSVNAKTDQALTAAEQNNRFDEEFLSIMTKSLTDYQRAVKAAYDNATSKKLKDALSTQFTSANTLAGVASKTE